MVDINFDFIITGVPSDEIADEIALGIRLYLLDNHNTDMVITWEEV